MRRFFAQPERFSSEGVSLDVNETRHLRDVLRLREGDEISVFNGEGREFLCRVVRISKQGALAEITAETTAPAPESKLDLTLAAGILKGEKFDLLIQKAVELGVTTVIPLITVRGNVKLKDVQKRLERWRKIVLEASKQCGRAKLMEVAEPSEFETYLRTMSNENLLLFSERGGEDFQAIQPRSQIIAAIGPEGGWDDLELEIARSAGGRIITLSGRILRAETAAISIAAILQHRFGDLN